MDTAKQYEKVIQKCRDLFMKKTQDYGTSWRIMRLPSITDQIYIKAQRIRTLQETGVSKVGEGIAEEYMAIVNYCVIAQMQVRYGDEENLDILPQIVAERYDEAVRLTQDLMNAKNHDYGEAWRQMRLGSLTDLILMKLHRTKQIEDNRGVTLVSEGVDANYQDMLNYAVFALIKMGFADN